MIADAFLQQILLRPAEYDVIATLNLNGDYISDALAAQVGGIGIAPGGEPLRRGRDVRGDARDGARSTPARTRSIPGSLILSAEMMLRHLGWREAADLIIDSLGGDDLGQDRHLRLRPPDGRRDRGLDCSAFGAGDDRAHVTEHMFV